MPVVQYSRIQHKRGNFVDLPTPLNTSELGHAVDQQRLFIGNGQLSDGAPIVGNTEIITDFTLINNPSALKYIYRSNTPVIAQTGITPNAPIVRSVGQKLDDFVSVRDFGAKGDGITDDTAAINRAFKFLYTVLASYPYAVSMAYRTLYFPAGTYLISDYIYTPPYAKIVGDGVLRTIVKQTNAVKTAVVRTADSLFQNGANLGNGGATLPSYISAEGITFQHVADQNIISLERASNVYFSKCGFLGAWVGGVSTSTGIYLDNSSHIDIKFDRCAFLHTYYAFMGQQLSQVYFDVCSFNNLGFGVTHTGSAIDIKVTNSIFDTIANSALWATPAANGVASENNTYKNCGNISYPVVFFQPGTLSCTSLNDKFFGNSGVNVLDVGSASFELSTVNSINVNNINISSKQGSITLGPAASSTSTGITIDLTINNSAFIDYTVVVGTQIRIGRLSILANSTTIAWSDSGNLVNADSGTGFLFVTPTLSSNILTVNYTLSGVTNAALSVQSKSWLS